MAFDGSDLSLSERIIEDVLCRLREIKQANGYRTDAGLYVLDSQQTIDPSMTPAIQVFEGNETATDADGSSLSMRIDLPLNITCHVKPNSEQTGRILRAAKADMKKALFRNRGAVGARSDGKSIATLAYGGCQTNHREDGDSTESISMRVSAVFREGYGDPYTQK